jgi:uncharacterized repeat protein (TIGR03803 family)
MMRQVRMVRAGLWALASLFFVSMQLALPGTAHAAPTVTAVSPTQGGAPGGDRVTITGTDFTSVQEVFFDGIESSGFTVNSATQITATTPPRRAPGPVTVSVRTAAGDSTGNVQFTYRALVNITTLHTFQSNDGSNPVGAVVFDKQGNLYGVTRWGGANDRGTVFMLAAPALTARTVLHHFSIRDGATPGGSLVIDDDGVLYGLTVQGGRANLGVVFRLTPPADPAQKPNAGAWRYDLLYVFKSREDGAAPSGLALDRLGNLYGTTRFGGDYEGGTLFKLTASRTVPWKKTRLHDFGSGVSSPSGPLLLDKNGYLVGTSSDGGPTNAGTVYSFALRFGPGGAITPVIRYGFGLGSADGAYPESGVTASRDNILYGTTRSGDLNVNGTVFQLKLVGGKWRQSVIAGNFTEEGTGYFPDGVVVAPGGALYGVMREGGGYFGGSLFKLSPPSGGQTRWTHRTLHYFGSLTFHGDDPNPLTMRGSVIYGTTQSGGPGNCCGTVYKAQEP